MNVISIASGMCSRAARPVLTCVSAVCPKKIGFQCSLRPVSSQWHTLVHGKSCANSNIALVGLRKVTTESTVMYNHVVTVLIPKSETALYCCSQGLDVCVRTCHVKRSSQRQRIQFHMHASLALHGNPFPPHCTL